MEHELWVKCEIFWEPKAVRIILMVIAKFLALEVLKRYFEALILVFSDANERTHKSD